jgi:hypothetical protein
LAGDPDGGGATNRKKFEEGTDPGDEDSDNDGITDGTELGAGLNLLLNDANDDFDLDDLTNQEELEAGTSPTNFDSDGDGVSSGDEILLDFRLANYLDTDGDGLSDGFEFENLLNGLDPSDACLDQDNDGLTELEEFEAGSDPLFTDTDEDGMSDFKEVKTLGTNPNVIDADSDGLTDVAELTEHNTDPVKRDTGDDGFSDSEELSAGTNPNTPGESSVATIVLSIAAFAGSGFNDSSSDLANEGSWGGSGIYYVRERVSDSAYQLKTQFFFRVDLSGLDPAKPVVSAKLQVYQIHKLNDLAANFSAIELGRVVDPWDLMGGKFSDL